MTLFNPFQGIREIMVYVKCHLKGVFAKNERGIGLMRKKNAFDRY